jgi:hypothetical protein
MCSRTLVLVLLALAAMPACKKKPVEAAPSPYAAGAAAPAPTETSIDALTPVAPRVDLAQRADTANGDPNGPKQAELDAAQGLAQQHMQTCLDALPPEATAGAVRLAVKYTVGNEGKASDVSVTGGTSAAMTACGTNAVAETAFPKFGGPSLSNSFVLSYSRPQLPDLAGQRAADLATPPAR